MGVGLFFVLFFLFFVLCVCVCVCVCVCGGVVADLSLLMIFCQLNV